MPCRRHSIQFIYYLDVTNFLYFKHLFSKSLNISIIKSSMAVLILQVHCLLTITLMSSSVTIVTCPLLGAVCVSVAQLSPCGSRSRVLSSPKPGSHQATDDLNREILFSFFKF